MHEGDHDPLALPEGKSKPKARRVARKHAHKGHGHDHDHGHDGHDHSHSHDHKVSAAEKEGGVGSALSFLIEDLRDYALPAAILLTVLASWEGALNRLLSFDVAILGAVFGGLWIIKDTAMVTWRKRRITSGVLVSIALIATMVVEDFRAAAIVALMMLIGEALESRTLRRTRRAVQGLLDLAPGTALVRLGEGYREIPVESVNVDDILLVKPGAKVPVDGRVVSGFACINQASITGESMPVDKVEGDTVYAGTTSASGAIEIVAVSVGEDTSLAHIIRIVRDARENKGEGQKVADRFASWLTPAVLVIAAVVWGFSGDVIRSVSVLVVACPCALVLATPTAVVAAIGSAARQGVLVKGGMTIEEAGRATAIILDKTGTLTMGRPRVKEIWSLSGLTETAVLTIAAMAETRSEHPIGRAVTDHAVTLNIDVPLPDTFEQVPGIGVRVTADNQTVIVGNRRALAEATEPDQAAVATEWLNSREEQGYTSLVVLADGKVLGGLAVGDTIREEAPALIQELKAMGLRVMMLTGDNARTAKAVAERLGVDDFRAEIAPADKAAVVTDLKNLGYRVAMVGDGVNDAPALATADVGIAMGVAGTDVAIEAADIALMADNLAIVPGVFLLSRAAHRIIKQNIYFFAFLINAVGMGFAAYGALTPIAAAVVHNVASVWVVMNSARLIGYRLSRPSADPTTADLVAQSTRKGNGNVSH